MAKRNKCFFSAVNTDDEFTFDNSSTRAGSGDFGWIFDCRLERWPGWVTHSDKVFSDLVAVGKFKPNGERSVRWKSKTVSSFEYGE